MFTSASTAKNSASAIPIDDHRMMWKISYDSGLPAAACAARHAEHRRGEAGGGPEAAVDWRCARAARSAPVGRAVRRQEGGEAGCAHLVRKFSARAVQQHIVRSVGAQLDRCAQRLLRPLASQVRLRRHGQERRRCQQEVLASHR